MSYQEKSLVILILYRPVSVSLEMLLKLVAVFATVVQSTVSARRSVGVDIHAEERYFPLRYIPSLTLVPFLSESKTNSENAGYRSAKVVLRSCKRFKRSFHHSPGKSTHLNT